MADTYTSNYSFPWPSPWSHPQQAPAFSAEEPQPWDTNWRRPPAVGGATELGTAPGMGSGDDIYDQYITEQRMLQDQINQAQSFDPYGATEKAYNMLESHGAFGQPPKQPQYSTRTEKGLALAGQGLSALGSMYNAAQTRSGHLLPQIQPVDYTGALRARDDQMRQQYEQAQRGYNISKGQIYGSLLGKNLEQQERLKETALESQAKIAVAQEMAEARKYKISQNELLRAKELANYFIDTNTGKVITGDAQRDQMFNAAMSEVLGPQRATPVRLQFLRQSAQGAAYELAGDIEFKRAQSTLVTTRHGAEQRNLDFATGAGAANMPVKQGMERQISEEYARWKGNEGKFADKATSDAMYEQIRMRNERQLAPGKEQPSTATQGAPHYIEPGVKLQMEQKILPDLARLSEADPADIEREFNSPTMAPVLQMFPRHTGPNGVESWKTYSRRVYLEIGRRIYGDKWVVDLLGGAQPQGAK